jgi:ABC-type oligopeptide transport system substrate-binding subunit
MQEIIASTGDPDDVMSYFGTGKLNNYIKYSNAEVDKLLDQQTVTNDLKARIAMTQQIERTILSDYVVIPARGSIYRTAWAPYVKGFVLPNAGYGGQLVYDRVWFDK